MSKITKMGRDEKNGFISFFPGCLLGSFDITLRTGYLVSVFPLCGHLGSFLLFSMWFVFFFFFHNDVKTMRRKNLLKYDG